LACVLQDAVDLEETKQMGALTPNRNLQYQKLADGPLLEAVLAKDKDAWGELLRRYRALMFRCITRVAARYDAVLSNEDANEIFGDMCFNLLRDDMHKLRAYDPARGAKLSSWLGLLAINTAYDYLRQTSRRPMLDRLENAPERPGDGPNALDALMEKERWGYLNYLLADFSERDRRFVELYYGHGLLPEEVAAAMGISVKTVYSKKNKLRTKLQALAASERRAA
jgi:RNA polymerase sigma-70 factor, ECF subfamily